MKPGLALEAAATGRRQRRDDDDDVENDVDNFDQPCCQIAVGLIRLIDRLITI